MKENMRYIDWLILAFKMRNDISITYAMINAILAEIEITTKSNSLTSINNDILSIIDVEINTKANSIEFIMPKTNLTSQVIINVIGEAYTIESKNLKTIFELICNAYAESVSIIHKNTNLNLDIQNTLKASEIEMINGEASIYDFLETYSEALKLKIKNKDNYLDGQVELDSKIKNINILHKNCVQYLDNIFNTKYLIISYVWEPHMDELILGNMVATILKNDIELIANNLLKLNLESDLSLFSKPLDDLNNSLYLSDEFVLNIKNNAVDILSNQITFDIYGNISSKYLKFNHIINNNLLKIYLKIFSKIFVFSTQNLNLSSKSDIIVSSKVHIKKLRTCSEADSLIINDIDNVLLSEIDYILI